MKEEVFSYIDNDEKRRREAMRVLHKMSGGFSMVHSFHELGPPLIRPLVLTWHPLHPSKVNYPFTSNLIDLLTENLLGYLSPNMCAHL